MFSIRVKIKFRSRFMLVCLVVMVFYGTKIKEIIDFTDIYGTLSFVLAFFRVFFALVLQRG